MQILRPSRCLPQNVKSLPPLSSGFSDWLRIQTSTVAGSYSIYTCHYGKSSNKWKKEGKRNLHPNMTFIHF